MKKNLKLLVSLALVALIVECSQIHSSLAMDDDTPVQNTALKRNRGSASSEDDNTHIKRAKINEENKGNFSPYPSIERHIEDLLTEHLMEAKKKLTEKAEQMNCKVCQLEKDITHAINLHQLLNNVCANTQLDDILDVNMKQFFKTDTTIQTIKYFICDNFHADFLFEVFNEKTHIKKEIEKKRLEYLKLADGVDHNDSSQKIYAKKNASVFNTLIVKDILESMKLYKEIQEKYHPLQDQMGFALRDLLKSN